MEFPSSFQAAGAHDSPHEDHEARRPSNPSSTASPASHRSPQNTITSPHQPAINIRSCITCRKRKVKCDKRQPCSNCTKQHIPCIFPSPGRAPRRPRHPPHGELLARLRRLEGVVQTMGGAQPEVNGKTEEKQDDEKSPLKSETGVDIANPELDELTLPKIYRIPGLKPENSTAGVEREFGRLMIIEDGRSQYVSNSFWANLNDEVQSLQGILEQDSEDEEDYSTPDTNPSISIHNHQGFLFEYSSLATNLRKFHPTPDQYDKMWDLYTTNIDPLLKVLHKPSAAKQIRQWRDNLDNVPKGMEALLFAIYYAVTTSLTPEETVLLFKEEKSTLLERYRFGCEQGLARAGFLDTQEMITLQAFVIFLVSVRRHDDSRFVWSLTGLAIRIAQSLGLHRDGTNFNLSPFEIDQRRRLWWQVVLLDIRSSEDYGTDPSVVEQAFDTLLPYNVNDSELDPDMKDPPTPHQGCTEMTFCLIRFEVTTTLRRLQYIPPGPSTCHYRAMTATLQEKEKWIEECHEYLEEKYLKYCNMNDPLDWVNATVARLIMAKMWLIVYHPLQRSPDGPKLPDDTRDRLFVTSVEIIEYSRLLETERRTFKWGWLFRTYVQWHALAFVLSELCNRTEGELVDRAWRAIESVFDAWGEFVVETKRGMLWRPIRKLVQRARAVRSQTECARSVEAAAAATAPIMASPSTTNNTADWVSTTPLTTTNSRHSIPSASSLAASPLETPGTTSATQNINPNARYGYTGGSFGVLPASGIFAGGAAQQSFLPLTSSPITSSPMTTSPAASRAPQLSPQQQQQQQSYHVAQQSLPHQQQQQQNFATDFNSVWSSPQDLSNAPGTAMLDSSLDEPVDWENLDALMRDFQNNANPGMTVFEPMEWW
ncbi:hypothetical protein L228DRAFT_266766 [Xylona heveae TC161]|uniref:Zn(2)-C6 fungal-type domain-containing protein n=1 Tax=Xylona heveae (strain CBS 132557 / TC161) TaxID=1328760 RepID=A0A161TQ50_XYLHT|nr:hypothetical protein L228DRAFT_266766 [Xylona heveae TC161]KZF24426.1 hypothetical protein L228DRAFT_266766 [Xylona heveae TC161]